MKPQENALLWCLCQVLRRVAEFSMLWGIAVSATIFLGEVPMAGQPNKNWLGFYTFLLTVVIDLSVNYLTAPDD